MLWTMLVPFAAAEERARPEERLRPVAAVRLATLAERIAKLHAQVGQGVLPERSRRALGEALREFDGGLRGMAARMPSAELRDNYLLLGLLWTEYRAWALKPPTRENARRLAERAEEVAWIAAKGARLLQAQAPANPLAFEAARCATLSQRIAHLHLLRRWERRDEALARNLAAASEDLRATLERLVASPANGAEVAAELAIAKGQHEFLSRAASEIEHDAPAARLVEVIAKSADHILEAMERAARLYEGQDRAGWMTSSAMRQSRPSRRHTRMYQPPTTMGAAAVAKRPRA